MLNQIKTAVSMVFFLALFVCFIISGLLINGVQFSIWLTLKPFSPWLYRKLNYYLLACLWSRKQLTLELFYEKNFDL